MSTSALPQANPQDATAGADARSDSVPGAEGAKRPIAPEVWKNITGYAAAALSSLVLVAVALQLWHARLNVPLFDSGDSLMGQLFVQNILESGWVLDNGRLGAPGALDLRDYPLADV